jgi:hypothetical protein
VKRARDLAMKRGTWQFSGLSGIFVSEKRQRREKKNYKKKNENKPSQYCLSFHVLARAIGAYPGVD